MRRDVKRLGELAGTIVGHWIAFGVRRPWRMLALWLLLLLLAGGGLARLRVETSGESILDKSNERWAFYRKSVELFGNDEVIVAAISSRDPYDPTALALVAEV